MKTLTLKKKKETVPDTKAPDKNVLNKRQRQGVALKYLQKTYPALFKKGRLKVMEVGAGNLIRQHLPDHISGVTIRNLLYRLTSNKHYQNQIIAGGNRTKIDGSTGSEINTMQRKNAEDRLTH